MGEKVTPMQQASEIINSFREIRSHRALIKISDHLLIESLHLPEGTEILGAQWDASTGTVEFMVFHPDIKRVPEGGAAPEVRPMLTRHAAIPERIEFNGWK